MISTYLAKSVESRDIKGIRGALKGIIDSDPAFIPAGGGTCEFDEAVSFILKRGIQERELFDVHDYNSNLPYISARQIFLEELTEVVTKRLKKPNDFKSDAYDLEAVKAISRIIRAVEAKKQFALGNV